MDDIARRIEKLVSRRVRDEQAAVSIVSDTLLALQKRIALSPPLAMPYAWARTVALNLISAYYRRLRREAGIIDFASDLTDLPSNAREPWENLAQTEMRRLLSESMSRIPPKYARLLTDIYYHGESVVEAALKRGIHRCKMYRELNSALNRLRHMLIDMKTTSSGGHPVLLRSNRSAREDVSNMQRGDSFGTGLRRAS